MSDAQRFPAQESPDSASPIITRAVAAALRDAYHEVYQLAGWQRFGLELLGRLPQNLGRAAIERFQAVGGLDPARLEGLSADRMAAERLRDYAGEHTRYANVTLGAPLGGAAAHIAALLDGPFLPATFVYTLQGGSPNGSVDAFLANSRQLANRIAGANPDLLAIQHFDPVHDGWMTRHVNHLRFKLLALPGSYRRFLERRLEAGGTVTYLDCGAAWLRYRLAPRQYLQIGGWGDIPAGEFIQGSPRLEAFCRENGLQASKWALADLQPETGPESEWGSEAGLAEALAEYCRAHGLGFTHIRLPHPHDFSSLAFEAQRAALAKDGRQPAGVLIETFTQFDVTATLRGGLLPLWLVFNTRDSLAYLQRMRAQFPADVPVFFSPLATFSITPDLVPWEDWFEVLEGCDVHISGVRRRHYPADPWALLHWRERLQSWVAENHHPIQSRLKARELSDLSQKIAVIMNPG